MSSIHRYKLKDGKQQLYRVTYRNREGKQTTRRGFRTKKDAQAFLATTEVDLLRGTHVGYQGGQVTVGKLYPDWAERQEQVRSWAPSTKHTNEVAWRVHVEPRWGAVKVSAIDADSVEQWVASMSKSGSGPVSVTRAVGVLRGVLALAVKQKRIAANPCAEVELPRKPKAKKRADGELAILNDAQVLQLATEAARGRGGADKGVVVLVLAYTGVRWGELAGLHKKDVKVLKRELVLHRNAAGVGGKVVVGDLKTHADRTVAFPASLAEPLSVVLADKKADDIVFPNAKGEYALSPGAGSWFDSAVKRCQRATEELRAQEAEFGEPVTPVFPRVTPHDLRHTFASLSISRGNTNVKVLQRQLGHESAKMTLDRYGHLLPGDEHKLADAHDEALSGANVVTVLSRGHLTVAR